MENQNGTQVVIRVFVPDGTARFADPYTGKVRSTWRGWPITVAADVAREFAADHGWDVVDTEYSSKEI